MFVFGVIRHIIGGEACILLSVYGIPCASVLQGLRLEIVESSFILQWREC